MILCKITNLYSKQKYLRSRTVLYMQDRNNFKQDEKFIFKTKIFEFKSYLLYARFFLHARLILVFKIKIIYSRDFFSFYNFIFNTCSYSKQIHVFAFKNYFVLNIICLCSGINMYCIKS